MKSPIDLEYSTTIPLTPRIVENFPECLTMGGHFGNAASRFRHTGWNSESKAALDHCRQRKREDSNVFELQCRIAIHEPYCMCRALDRGDKVFAHGNKDFSVDQVTTADNVDFHSTQWTIH